jgi:hypothetical protein
MTQSLLGLRKCLSFLLQLALAAPIGADRTLSLIPPLMTARSRLCSAHALFLLLTHACPAYADSAAPAAHVPRGRPCCALAADMALHLGSTHVPIVIRGVISARGIGRHSYSTDGELTENNGLLYTRRGGFIDTAHTRDNADIAAHLALTLRPLLAHGEGSVDLGLKGAARSVHITRAVPERDLARTSDRIAVRIAFYLSIWTELVQYYGLTKFRGAEEIYSSFTVDDPYSNLMGATLGVVALESRVPYDRAMDIALSVALANLGVVSQGETRRVLARLAGTWWSPDYAWPASELAIVREYPSGPLLSPRLAPKDVIAPQGEPVVLDIPQRDDEGTPLSEYYRLEIRPQSDELERFPRQEQGRVLAEADIPRLVSEVRRALDAEAAKTASSDAAATEASARGRVGHYLTGIRLLELSAAGGVSSDDRQTTGVASGGLQVVRGDSRGGDFGLMKLDVLHTPSRGLMTGLGFFRADAVWFCHDPETGGVRAPLLSLLGPCAGGEWLGVGGSLGEALHDGRTGRTALRPISLAAVLNPLGNGQSPSYDSQRLLLRSGAEVEHIWSAQRGGRTLPRALATLSWLLRTPSQHFELRGALGYRLDLAEVRDDVFESDLRLGYNFLLGGTAATGARARSDPWGLATLAVEGCYTYWARPENAYPEITAPFVSTDRAGTWQLLMTASLGFEGLSF